MTSASATQRSISRKWARVSKQSPCPICHKPDWCMVSMDRHAAICARTETDRPAGNKGAGWIHELDHSATLPPQKPTPNAPQTPKASPDVLNAVYSALLGHLPLSANHADNLRHRGLTSEEIRGLGYRTLARYGRREVVVRLGAFKLAGVPGFYQESGGWRLAGPSGIAIPVRDMQGRIIGLQIRCDRTDAAKYRWISSRGFDQGCSPGAPVHIAGRVAAGADVWVTEGPLKADIAALRLGCTMLAVAGVGNWAGIIPIVLELKPGRVIIAFDMDKTSNSAVQLHANTLIATLIRHGIRTFEADWNPVFKGLDDLITEAR